MRTRRVLWQRTDVPGVEWCQLTTSRAGDSYEGITLLAAETRPWRIEYTIELDEHGRTRRTSIHADGRRGPLTLNLEANGAGAWSRDGRLILAEPDAIDLDLAFSPATNSLPIRRLGLAVGESRRIGVAWVDFPTLELTFGRQTYERLDERHWRYRSEGFEAELDVDADGLVETYAHWRAVARA